MSLQKVLQDYGLTEKEAAIYLACLQIGSGSVPSISKKAGQPKTTCYEVLEKLREKGFVSTYQKNKSRCYIANNPTKALAIAKEKIAELEKHSPQLCALFANTKNIPVVRVFQDKKQIGLVFREILDEAKELYGFASADDVLKELDKYHTKFLEERVRRKIPIKLILNDTPTARERQRIGPGSLRTVKLVPRLYEYHSLVYIWNDKVALISLSQNLTAVVIQCKELANIQLTMFKHLWERL
jgi:sugar-specific transcriptional regulator TrmB